MRVLGTGRGYTLYSVALASLRDAGPATPMELNERLQMVDRATLRRVLPQFWRAGMVHVCGWNLHGRAWLTPVFAFGPGEDAPKPPGKRSSGRAAPQAVERVATYLAVIQSAQSPSTLAELCREAGVTVHIATPLIRILRAHGLMHIHSWADARTPRYLATSGADAKRPKSLTKAERDAASFKRKMQAKRAAEDLAQQSARVHLEPAKVASWQGGNVPDDSDEDYAPPVRRSVAQGKWAVDPKLLPPASVFSWGGAQ